MRKFLTLIIFLVFVLGFFLYQLKFKSGRDYVIEDGVPYFKEENDVLKIYPHDGLSDDIVDNVVIYDVLDKNSESKK
jgi:hypothetical protein